MGRYELALGKESAPPEEEPQKESPEKIPEPDIDNLRREVDNALSDPNFSITTSGNPIINSRDIPENMRATGAPRVTYSPFNIRDTRVAWRVAYDIDPNVNYYIDRLCSRAVNPRDIRLPSGGSYSIAFSAAHDFFLLGNAFLTYLSGELRLLNPDNITVNQNQNGIDYTYSYIWTLNNNQIPLNDIIHLALKHTAYDTLGSSVLGFTEQDGRFTVPDIQPITNAPAGTYTNMSIVNMYAELFSSQWRTKVSPGAERGSLRNSTR
jgi:hypothetical protein